MAELVRPKKPKHRERAQSDYTPPIPDRPAIVNGLRLPAVITIPLNFLFHIDFIFRLHHILLRIYQKDQHHRNLKISKW